MGIDQPKARSSHKGPHSPLCGLSAQFGQASMDFLRIGMRFPVAQVVPPLS